jgi:hypothetical protein
VLSTFGQSVHVACVGSAMRQPPLLKLRLSTLPRLSKALGLRSLRASFPPLVDDPIFGVMTLYLTDHETALLLKELNGLIDGDRYFLSDRIKTLKAIRAKIKPEPAREAPAAATKTVCPAAGNRGKETARKGAEASRNSWDLIFPHLSSQHPTMLGCGSPKDGRLRCHRSPNSSSGSLWA